MKLKDQFAKATGNGTYYVIPIVEDAEIIEKIADEFAIGFAYWIRACKLKGRPYDFDNMQCLLKIYKDEQGL